MLFAQMQEVAANDTTDFIFRVAVLLFFAAYLWLFVILHACARRIPPWYRKMEPWRVWMVVIPCIGCLYGLSYFPNLARSYQKYFKAQRNTDVGDCGYDLSWLVAWSIVFASWFPPLAHLAGFSFHEINIYLGPLSLVLLVLFVIKAEQLKKLIPKDAARIERAKRPLAKQTAGKTRISDEPVLGEIDLDLDSLSSALAGSTNGGSPLPPEKTGLQE
jgi:hypothetical protein